MNRLTAIVAFFLLGVAMCFGQNAPSSQASANPAAPAEASDPNAVHGVIPVTLSKSLDSKKMKEGDEVDGKTVAALRTGSGIMIPSGSKVVGHVTQAKAKSKGDSEASLGLAFDKIEVAGGKDLPIKGSVQAVGPNPVASSGPDTGAAGGGTMAAHGGDPTTMASPLSGAGVTPGQQPGQPGAPQGKMLNAHSTGVVGIKNLQLENSVLTTTNKEVKLDSGSQMLIKAE